MLKANDDYCKICFDALSAHLKQEPLPQFDETAQVPLFVTWKKQGHLRGCIGNLSPIPFPQGLIEYAVRAGVKDSRFDPITLSELPKLTVGVSLLVDFTPDHKWDDWEIGKHGIVLSFEAKGRIFKSVFLPEVAPEQGWTKRETIYALAKKSGYDGKLDDAFLANVSIESFLSSKAEMAYQDWRNKSVETELRKRHEAFDS